MISTQVCIGLVTIKGQFKMCSFITQHNATGSVQLACSESGSWPWWGRCSGLARATACSSCCRYPSAPHCHWSGSTFHRLQSALCKRDVALHEINDGHTPHHTHTYTHVCQVDGLLLDYLGKGEVLTITNLWTKFERNILIVYVERVKKNVSKNKVVTWSKRQGNVIH